MAVNYFKEPEAPTAHGGMFAYLHEHEWTEVGAQLNPNGTHSSLWGCAHCPDVAIGDYVGPIPEGFCLWCNWVQRKPKRKKCEDCGQPMPKKGKKK